MSAWLPDELPSRPQPTPCTDRVGRADPAGRPDVFALLGDDDCHRAAQVTAAGAVWLTSASAHARSMLALWESRPTAPAVLSCGRVFDVVSVESVFGRRMLDRLWTEGPGSGPVAVHRGRLMLFAAPGTAQRLPSLLRWQGDPPTRPDGGSPDGGEGRRAVPPMLCHGAGDAVTVPPLVPGGEADGPRWLVAPDTRQPWLPGPDTVLWAATRAARGASSQASRASSPAGWASISHPADQGANVYDVSRRR
ncbi:bifunctional DNA primase/polymerase [Streptomyces sp. ODS05-4]|uniref:bifunctional DNA primase/polymerase n=1 Tax=Streptomyces sp. ODS05-4 TaxID=2944939 RepID=UPI00210B2A04|nr:bifunctional DNA primase/polymerase [Streptomyces sp. ODS05-4]